MTAIGGLLLEYLALTSAELEACGGPCSACLSSCEPSEPSSGMASGSGVSVKAELGAGERRAEAAGAPTSSPSSTKDSDPGSGIARPVGASGEPVSYLKTFLIVGGASGSLASRKFCHAARPAALPNFFSNVCSASAERSSAPPPLPKMPPISDASAITSVSFHVVGALPSAAYSAGILLGVTSASAM